MKIIEKRKGVVTCADCGSEMAAGATTCADCGSENVTKSIIIIRKETPDADDAVIEEVDVDDDVDEDDDDEEVADDDEEEDDEEDDDDTEEDDKEEEVPPVVAKSLKGNAKKIAFVEALNLSTALAESVTKILAGDITKASNAYENVMTEFNTVLDSAFDQWVSGTSVSKANSLDTQTSLITNRVSQIIKEGGAVMPKKITRPESLDSAELPDDITAYITALEGDTPVEKSDDIYKGLTPAVAEIVRKAAATNEQNEAQKYIDIAKGFTHIPGDKVALAKSLRQAAESSEENYNVLLTTLTASNENLSQSDVFKSFGHSGAGGDKVSKNHTAAEELVSKGTFATIEAAEVSLMGGDDYVSTAK